MWSDRSNRRKSRFSLVAHRLLLSDHVPELKSTVVILVSILLLHSFACSSTAHKHFTY